MLHTAIKQTAVRFAFDPLIKIMMLACCGQTVIIALKTGELLSYLDKKPSFLTEGGLNQLLRGRLMDQRVRSYPHFQQQS